MQSNSTSKFSSQITIRSRPKSGIIYESSHKKTSPSNFRMLVPANTENTDIDKFVLKPAPSKMRTLSTKKTYLNDTTQQSRMSNTEFIKNSPVVQEMVKKIPLSQNKDRDDLYQEVVFLKDQINKLNQENYDLKAKLRFMQKDNERMQQVIENVGGYLQNKHDDQKSNVALMTKLGISENLLTVTLKKQIKDVRKQLKEQAAEIEKLKHVTKYTQIQELEEQINQQNIELVRLRTLLDQSQRNELITQMTHDFNSMEEKFFYQMQIINELKKENEYHISIIRLLEEQKSKLEFQIENDGKVVKKQIVHIDDLTQTLKDKTVYAQGLEQEIIQIQEINENLVIKNNLLDNNQLRIISLVKTEAELRKDQQQKKRDIEYLDGVITELKQKLADKSSYEAKEKLQLQNELTKLKNQYEELEAKHKHFLNTQQQMRMRETFTAVKQTMKSPAINDKNQTESIIEKRVPKKYKTVQKEDVLNIGLEINYRFRLRRLELADVMERFLFDNKNKKNGEVRLIDLQKRLQKEPFMIIDDDAALLLARYLTEDNTQEFVGFNEEIMQQLSIVRSIMTNLVGPYKILTQQEEDEKTKIITDTIKKYRNSMIQYFEQQHSNHEGFLTRTQIMDTFEYMDIEMAADLYDYMFVRLFQYSNNPQLFSYNKIFELFHVIEEKKQQEEQKRPRKQTTQNKKETLTRRQSQENY